MNKQEIFNKAYKGVMTQGCRAVGRLGACQYENAQGNKCAIGHCLPGGHEAFTAVGNIWAVLNNHPDLKEHFGIEGPGDGNFLTSLQRAHDDCRDPDSFVVVYGGNMRAIASRHDLTVPKLPSV